MHDLCILFAYHRCDELTRRHLALVQQHNPGVPVVPLTDDVPELLPGSFDVGTLPQPWRPERELDKPRPWHQADTMVYRWFLHRSVTAARYVVLEYDCLCTAPLREVYAEVWDAAAAGSNWYTPETHPRWWWFRCGEADLLDPGDRPFAAGLSPLAGTFFSHEGLAAIVAAAPRRDVFCELRLGTAARKAGLQVALLPEARRRTIQWTPYEGSTAAPGLYHAVKDIGPMAAGRAISQGG